MIPKRQESQGIIIMVPLWFIKTTKMLIKSYGTPYDFTKEISKYWKNHRVPPVNFLNLAKKYRIIAFIHINLWLRHSLVQKLFSWKKLKNPLSTPPEKMKKVVSGEGTKR